MHQNSQLPVLELFPLDQTRGSTPMQAKWVKLELMNYSIIVKSHIPCCKGDRSSDATSRPP